jgi:hypothetical protein
MDIRLTHNARELSRLLGREPERLRAAFSVGVLALSKVAQQEIVERTPKFNSDLRNSILPGAEFIGQDGGISRRLGSPLIYAAPVEFGRRPAPVPFEPLFNWVRRKLGLEPGPAAGFTKYLQWKKRRFATPGVFMFRDGTAEAQKRAPVIWNRAFQDYLRGR